MNDIRNWSPLAAIKLFTTRKRNAVEWPKMHNLQNGIYTFLRGYTLASLYLFHGALRLDLLSSPIEIYVIIGLGIFVLENYTWLLPRNDPEGMGRYTQPILKKTKSTFKLLQKFPP